MLKKFCTGLVCLCLLLSLGVGVFADGTVTYDGAAQSFIFAPGSEESPTNLFGNFRNVMPGDQLTDRIVIKNDASKGVKIKVYLRALGAQENTRDLLSQLQLTVQKNEDTVLFAAPADETAQLTDWVYLGTLYSGGEITLDVKLDVPITLDNAFQDQVGYLDWSFKVEELPVEPDDPQPPKTGDRAPVIYSAVAVVSLAAVFLLLLLKKRKQDSKEA